MKKIFAVLFSTAILLSLSGMVFAKGGEMNCPMQNSPEMKAKMEQKKAEFEQRLNLTEDQKTKIKAIREQSREKIKPLFESMKVERAKLHQLKESGASQKEIDAQKTKLKMIREKIKEEQKANFEKVQSILTPDQQKEFNKIHEEHKKEFAKHKGEFKKQHKGFDE